MSKLPSLYFSTSHLPAEQGFETWRMLMAPMYEIKPFSRAGRHPGGSTVGYLLGDILANRTYFTAQDIIRSRRMVDATPDHVVFQVWRTGGFCGSVGSQRIEHGPGTVAFADRRRVLDVRFNASDTIGVVVPRAHFDDHLLAMLDTSFEGARNRLLRARIVTLYQGLPSTCETDAPALRDELLGFLRRIIDPSQTADVLEGRELDVGLLALAERHIAENLDADLTAESVAAAIDVSRSTLYRLFAPHGGVMQVIKERRLLAIRDALMDPLENRTIGRVAAAFGVTNATYLSRSFRARFDTTPRDWREACRAQTLARGTYEPFWRWFYGLGRKQLQPPPPQQREVRGAG